MEVSNFYFKEGTGLQRSFKRWSVLLVALLAFVVGFSQNFPFPQNYNYSYGIKPTNSDPSVIQARFAEWKTKYYEESSANQQARIKFLQPGEDGSATVSEGIAYGMLIMVYMDNSSNNTQKSFDWLYNYYKASVNGNNLMNWKVTGFGNPAVIDPNAASDADVDVATALLMADKQWGSSSGAHNYLSEANAMIGRIWNFETKDYGASGRLLKPGDMFADLVNASYFITNSFKLFDMVDNTHNWTAFAENHYSIISTSANSSTGLVPDWSYPDGSLISAGSNVGDACPTPANSDGMACNKFGSHFLYDAIRVPWRMAHDYVWYGDTRAKAICDKITNWAQANYSNPSSVVDGYNLNGSERSTYHNACFTGGLGIAAMCDASNQSYLNSVWNYASASEGAYSQYFTTTTQILYLLCMSGNMPNFWDMEPTPTTAYNSSAGGCSAIYVEFNKPMSSSSVSSSTGGWSVTMDNANTPIPINVTAASLQADGKTIKLTLAAPTEEPLIEVAFSGTLLAADNKTTPAFSGLQVTDNLFCARPFAASAATDIAGEYINIAFSKDMDASTFVAGDFSAKVNGSAVSVESATADAEGDKTIVRLKITTGSVTANSDVITVSYTAGSLVAEDGGIPKSFTNMNVLNNFMVETCIQIENFDPFPANTWITWPPGVVAVDAANPDGTGNVCMFTKGTGDADVAVKVDGTFASINEDLKANPFVKVWIYSSKAGANIRLQFMDNTAAKPWEAAVSVTETVATANTWEELVFDFSTQSATPHDLNCMQIDIEPGVALATAQTIYFNDIRLCPPPPDPKFERAYTSYDGNQLFVKFQTAMAVPSSYSGFTFTGASTTIDNISIDPYDQTILVFDLSSAITSNATLNYSGTTVKGLNGLKLASPTSVPILSLFGRSVAKGWYDDFETDDPSDPTNNIGGGAIFTRTEDVPNGIYTVSVDAATGDDAYIYFGPNVETGDEVWDLTDNPVVEFSAAIPSGSGPLWLGVRLKDLVTGMNTDGVLPQQITADGAQHVYTFDFTGQFNNQYGAVPGPVDATNIVVAEFYLWAEAAHPHTTWANTDIDFEYISIGSAIRIYDSPPSNTFIPQGDSFTAKSSSVGEIYMVPGGTPRTYSALRDSVLFGSGLKVDVPTADVNVNIPTTGLNYGYYVLYAYDPVSGAISRKSPGINLQDVTPPIIIDASDGDYTLNDAITVTVNEDATVYIIPSTANPTTILEVGVARIHSFAVSGGVPTGLLVSEIPGIDIGDKIKFIAIDKAKPDGLLSTVSTEIVTIVNPSLFLSIDYTPNGTGDLDQGGDINVTLSRSATAYLIPNTVVVSTVADLIANEVATVDITGTSGVLSTVGVPEGQYYVYASDGTDIVGPSSKITIVVSYVAATDVAVTDATLTVNVSESVTNTVSFTPASPTVTDVTLGFDNTYVNATYNATTKIITIEGVAATASTTVTVTHDDGPSTSFEVEVIQLPTSITVAPATSDIGVGGTIQLAETVLPADANNKAVTWSSDAPTTASVSATGLVTGVALGGPVTITATSVADGTVVGTATINVVETGVTDITVDPTEVILTLGDSRTISITVIPTDASDKTVTWTTSNSAIATVTGGVISSQGVGSCIITVTSNDNSSVSVDIPVTVNDVAVTGVSVTPTTETVLVGSTVTLTSAVTPSNAPQGVTWTSSNDAIATVSGGVVTGVSVGQVTITATSTADNTFSASATVTVDPVLVSGITLSDLTLSLVVGNNATLTKTVAPTNATDKTVTWSSSNETIATVDASGVITTLAVGTATITATANDASGISASCDLTVTPRLVTSISVTPATLALDVLETQTLTASVLPANATDKTYTWSSSNDAVATVSTGGIVTGVAEGTATITATANDGSTIVGTCAVTVSNVLPLSVTTSTSLGFVSGGASQTLSATVLPANTTNKSVTWSTSDANIATVDAATGEVTPVGVGTCIITVTCDADNSVTANCNVTVDASETLATSISLDQTTATLAPNGSVTLTETVLPAETTNKSVTWTTSNDLVATVSNGIVTAVGIGTATITATTSDGTNLTATCDITVSTVSATSVTLDQTTLTMTPSSTPVQLNATVLPADASDKSVTWSSSDNNIATVSATGVVTPVAVGTATITVTTTDGGHTAICTVTVSSILVTSMSIDQADQTMTVESTPVALTVSVLPADASDKSVTWSTSDANVATVSTTGVVSAVGVGTATITATTKDGSNLTSSITVTVSAIPVTGVTLIPALLELSVTGSGSQLTATVAPSTATDKSVSWTSSNNGVATVVNGLVTPVAEGSCIVTVTTNDGGYSATCNVVVSNTVIVVTGVSLNQTTLNLPLNDTYQLIPAISPSTASNKAVSWSSSNTAVVTVDTDGNLTPLTTGTATITVTTSDGSFTATCAVTVTDVAVTGVTLSQSTVSLIVGGSSVTLTETVLPAGASDKSVTWSSSDNNIATVVNGVVSPVAQGTCTVTVTTTDGSFTAIANVTVNNDVVPVTSISFSQTTGLTVSETGTLNLANLLVINPTGASVQSIVWSTSNSAYATVDANGIVSGQDVTLNRDVNISVTVTDMNGGTKTATVVVKVTVDAVAVQSITIPTAISVEVSGTKTIAVTEVLPAIADNKSVTWSVASGTAGTIDAGTGVITATGTVGETFTVIATATDGSGIESNACTVTIIDQLIELTGISLSLSATEVVVDGATSIITINVTPLDATELSFTVVPVPATSAVTISEITPTTWEITGNYGAENVVIQVQSNDHSNIYATKTIDVIELVSSISITQPTSSIDIGSTYTLQSTVNQSTASNKNLTWTSSDETVATVSATGVVTGVSEGTAVITATAQDGSNVSQSVNVTVTSVPVSDITVSTSPIEVEVGKTATITYAVSPSNATVKDVTFTSSDESILTVDQNGVITGVSYDSEAGQSTATVTITSTSNPSVTEQVVVVVIPVQADKEELKMLIDLSYDIYLELMLDPDLFAEKVGSQAGQIPLSTWLDFEDILLTADDIYVDLEATQTEVDDISAQLRQALTNMNYTIPDPVGLDEVSVTVSVYPVPFVNEITVDADGQIETVNVVDSKGSVIYTESVNGTLTTIDAAEFNSGVYYIQVITSENVIVKKAVKY